MAIAPQGSRSLLILDQPTLRAIPLDSTGTPY